MSKVGILTGGASGIGLETAKLLNQTGDWSLHLLDLNDEAGRAALTALPNAKVHQVDVLNYDALGKVFQTIFEAEGRIDFVLANAGRVDRRNFYETEVNGTAPPADPTAGFVSVGNFQGAINTTHLAMHYMRISPNKGQGSSIVMTSSSIGLYPSDFVPVYAASKAGVLHFMRSISPTLYHQNGIRCYAILPGTVRTNLMIPSVWDSFHAECFTPVEKVAFVVSMLEKGGELVDSNGKRVAAGKDYGLAVEINVNNHYFREGYDFCDDNMRLQMERGSLEVQAQGLKDAQKVEEGHEEAKLG